jgi:hypothetical protein
MAARAIMIRADKIGAPFHSRVETAGQPPPRRGSSVLALSRPRERPAERLAGDKVAVVVAQEQRHVCLDVLPGHPEA